MKTAEDALAWMEELRQSSRSLWLFRGQRQVFPRIQSSLARLAGQTRDVMYNVCRRFHTAAAGVTGYQIPSALDRLALLQHYIGLSPLIDLTGTPLIALYFALQGSSIGDECIVYALNTDLHVGDDAELVVVDHSFLALPLANGGLRHRWLRQDGYAACPAGWPSMDAVVEFDLLRVRGLESLKFVRRAHDLQIVVELGDLESLDGDSLACLVRGVVDSVLRTLPPCQELYTRIASSRTTDPASALRNELRELGELASALDAPETVHRSLEGLVDAEHSNVWDTSYDASLDWLKAELEALQRRQTGKTSRERS
jgi:hypothetical protein